MSIDEPAGPGPPDRKAKMFNESKNDNKKQDNGSGSPINIKKKEGQCIVVGCDLFGNKQLGGKCNSCSKGETPDIREKKESGSLFNTRM